MTTADLLACLEQVTGKINYEQFRTWVVAQSVRNALEPFHGSRAFDRTTRPAERDSSAMIRCAYSTSRFAVPRMRR